jgi:bifunctional DNase/RNase
MIKFRVTHRPYGVLLFLLSAALQACGSTHQTEVEVEVRSVGFDNASHAPVVLLQDHEHKMALPIWIGPTEAQSIAMQMQGVSPPRPLTHDLIKTMLDQAGVEFRKVVIKDLKENTYYASIYLHTGQHDLEIDSRPSDAIALAVRFHRPIFVSSVLLKGEATLALQEEAAGARTVKFSGVTVQNLTDALAELFSLQPGTGVLVADVESPAPGGLKRGDVILEVDGAAITSVGDFETKMQAVKHGTRANLSVQRGRELVQVQLAGQTG